MTKVNILNEIFKNSVKGLLGYFVIACTAIVFQTCVCQTLVSFYETGQYLQLLEDANPDYIIPQVEKYYAHEPLDYYYLNMSDPKYPWVQTGDPDLFIRRNHRNIPYIRLFRNTFVYNEGHIRFISPFNMTASYDPDDDWPGNEGAVFFDYSFLDNHPDDHRDDHSDDFIGNEGPTTKFKYIPVVRIYHCVCHYRYCWYPCGLAIDNAPWEWTYV